jgi:hypothetical protein
MPMGCAALMKSGRGYHTERRRGWASGGYIGRAERSWAIIRGPDRPGIKKAIAWAGGIIDLCHYDSDKSWWGRQYGYPLL